MVAVNAFPTDHGSEHAVIREIAEEAGARVAVSTHFSDGGPGAVELAEAVAEAAEEPTEFRLLYPDSAPLREKIATVAREVYGADGVEYSAVAARQIDAYERDRIVAVEFAFVKGFLLGALVCEDGRAFRWERSVIGRHAGCTRDEQLLDGVVSDLRERIEIRG